MELDDSHMDHRQNVSYVDPEPREIDWYSLEEKVVACKASCYASELFP